MWGAEFVVFVESASTDGVLFMVLLEIPKHAHTTRQSLHCYPGRTTTTHKRRDLFSYHFIFFLRSSDSNVSFVFFFAFRIASLVAACTRGSCYVCAVCAHCAMQWHRLKLKSVLCARMRIFCNKLWKIMAATNLMHYPGAFVVVFYLFLLLTWPAGESGKCFMPCTSWHFSYFFVFSFFAFCPPYFCHLAVLLLTGNRLTSA